MEPELPDAPDLPAGLLQQAEQVSRGLVALQRLALDVCGAAESAEEAAISWTSGMTAELLAEQALDNARRAASADCPVRPNRVYCYHCDDADCEHAVPPTPGLVFGGYENTGRPEWIELYAYLHSLGDERVEMLFGGDQHLLARVVSRKRLINKQFESFGRASLTYRVIGQVVAGYLRVRNQRCAVTVQVVETVDRSLHLQLITPEFVTEVLTDATRESAPAFHRIFDAIRDGRRRIEALTPKWRATIGKAERNQLREKLFAVLRHLAHSFERKSRQHRRRTAHAEQRSKEHRPVHKAREDLETATPDQFFRDNKTRHIVVTGKSGRSHVFSEDGRHVTSLMLNGDMLERRTRRRRYAALDADAIDAVRTRALARGCTPAGS